MPPIVPMTKHNVRSSRSPSFALPHDQIFRFDMLCIAPSWYNDSKIPSSVKALHLYLWSHYCCTLSLIIIINYECSVWLLIFGPSNFALMVLQISVQGRLTKQTGADLPNIGVIRSLMQITMTASLYLWREAHSSPLSLGSLTSLVEHPLHQGSAGLHISPE